MAAAEGKIYLKRNSLTRLYTAHAAQRRIPQTQKELRTTGETPTSRTELQRQPLDIQQVQKIVDPEGAVHGQVQGSARKYPYDVPPCDQYFDRMTDTPVVPQRQDGEIQKRYKLPFFP